MPYRKRIDHLRRSMADLGMEAFLVADLINIRYLSGFTGSAGLVMVTAEEACLITDFRYRIQAAGEVKDLQRVEQTGSMETFLRSFLSRFDFRKIGFEDTCSYRFAQLLREMAEPGSAIPARDLVERSRMIKDPDETAIMEKMVEIANGSFQEFVAGLRPGTTEREAAFDLECLLRKAGSGPPPFPIIVASGPNSAMPHARATDRAIEPGESVVVDFGSSGEGYATDITRTFCLGWVPDDIAKVYRLVYDAQKRAIDALRPGVRAAEIDAAARSVIHEAGMGDNFGHATGHGVGMSVHEGPRLSRESRDRLEAGMVVTVEPGVYLEGLGGIRIEDMVLVTGSGCRVLTSEVRKPETLQPFCP